MGCFRRILNPSRPEPTFQDIGFECRRSATQQTKLQCYCRLRKDVVRQSQMSDRNTVLSNWILRWKLNFCDPLSATKAKQHATQQFNFRSKTTPCTNHRYNHINSSFSPYPWNLRGERALPSMKCEANSSNKEVLPVWRSASAHWTFIGISSSGSPPVSRTWQNWSYRGPKYWNFTRMPWILLIKQGAHSTEWPIRLFPGFKAKVVFSICSL